MTRSFADYERPLRRPGVEWVELDNEVVVYDPATQSLHRLNASAAHVWLACDGTTSVDQLVNRVARLYTETGETIGTDVRALLGRLVDAGIVAVVA